MSELIHLAFDEATEQAARLPSEPVGAVVFLFSADGTGAPILACEDDAVPLIAGRLMQVAKDMLRQLNGGQDVGDDARDDRRDLLEAERITVQVITKARRP